MTEPLVRVEILGHDGDKLRRFYADVLGWPAEGPGAPATGGSSRMTARGGITIGVGKAPEGLPRVSTFYARVPDLAEALAKALAHGSEVLVAPVLLRHTVIAVVSDPEGNPVGLCT